MPSQFFGLNISYKGLLASNAALNTTANNIANVQTEGYSRQQVVQQASEALRVFQTYGCIGAGVETLAIERIRDEFYDGKYWNNQAKVGEFSIKDYYMTQIETYFDDNGSTSGFKSIFDNMMVSSLEELMKDPSSASFKSQFIGNADALAEYFNNLWGNMQALQKDINQEIKLKVDEINSIAGEIATLNKQINVIEMSGSKANELRDRRTLLIDQLSEIVDVQTSETPIVDLNNPDRETGANRYIIRIAGGQTLVDDTEFHGLTCVARTNYEKVNQSDIDGLYEIYWENGQRFNLYNSSMGGTLQGLIQMRDGNNGEYFNGTVIETDIAEDGLRDTVTVEVTNQYLKDLNKSNLSDQGGIITLGNRQYYYDSWTYNCTFNDAGQEVVTYTFTLSDKTKNPQRITNDRMGTLATVGTYLTYQGVPYYMSQMNEWVRTFSQKFNDILQSGYDGYGNQGNILFTGKMATDDDQYDFPSEDRYDTFTYESYQEKVQELVAQGLSEEEAKKQASMSVDVTDDSYYRMTAGNFGVLSAMLIDASLLANRYDAGDGVEQNDLLSDLRLMAYDKDEMNFRGCNASEFLQCVLGDIALNANRARTFTSNFTGISNIIDNQRLSISGVDEDEEALNLVKYQNGYSLASKMIQTLTEVYDRLILQTGV